MGITSDSVVLNRQDLPGICRTLLDQFGQAVLIEEFLCGREFTTGVVGTGRQAKVMGTMEIIVLADPGKDIYSFENKEGWKDRVQYLLVRGCGPPDPGGGSPGLGCLAGAGMPGRGTD